jgi:hypothetical protein
MHFLAPAGEVVFIPGVFLKVVAPEVNQTNLAIKIMIFLMINTRNVSQLR